MDAPKMNLTLTRVYGLEATPGTLILGGTTLYSIELPWRDNANDVSCVPEGIYQMVPYESPSHGPTWVLVNDTLEVGFPPDRRTYAEIHSANWAEQLKACIALGLEGRPEYDPLTGKVEPAVEDSRPAIAHLLEVLGPLSPGHTLTITSATGMPP
jgi:uncharacterized protein DUF5675